MRKNDTNFGGQNRKSGYHSNMCTKNSSDFMCSIVHYLINENSSFYSA